MRSPRRSRPRRPGWARPPNASSTACLVAGETSNWVSLNMTGATAALPSSDTSRMPDDMSSRAAPWSSLAALRLELGLALRRARPAWRRARPRPGRACRPPRPAPRAASSWAWPCSSWVVACSSCARPAAICCSWAARSACVANGSTTCATPSMSDAAATRALIAAFWASVRALPSSVSEDDVPLPPAAAGNSAARRSVTCAVGVPGMDRPVARWPPPKVKATPAMARIASQARTTVRLRRLAKPADPIEKFSHVMSPDSMWTWPLVGASKDARPRDGVWDGGREGRGGAQPPGAAVDQALTAFARSNPPRSSAKHSWSRRSRSGWAGPAGGLELECGDDRRDRRRRHEVGVDVGRRVGARPGCDDLGDHADRLVEHAPSGSAPSRGSSRAGRRAPRRPSGLATTLAAMSAKTCSSETRIGSSAGRSRSASTWTWNSERQAATSASSLRAEVVVECPHGHVGGGRDVVGRDRLQSALEGEAEDRLADRGRASRPSCARGDRCSRSCAAVYQKLQTPARLRVRADF